MGDEPTIQSAYSFDQRGPKLGDVQLLENTILGFQPLSPQSLRDSLAEALGYIVEIGRLTSALGVVCRALNDRDLAGAAVAACFLPDLSSCSQSAPPLLKASPSDPKHPGWPKGAPDSKGGEFRSKDDFDATSLRTEERKKRVQKLKSRRSFRSILRRMLTAKRVTRLFGEVVGDLVPGLDIVSDLATAADLKVLADELAADVAASKTALEFTEAAPKALESLMVDAKEVSFSSYESFLKTDVEKRYGPAGDGMEYHHIVEQGPNALRFSAEQLQSTTNIIRLPKLLHEEISSFYARPYPDMTGKLTVRNYLRTKNFDEQQNFGRLALQHLGITK